VIRSYRGKAVLVTGGTAGIGLATALAFARHGAECTLTYRFGSADEDEVRGRFAALGAPEPHIVQADASRDDDTDALLQGMRERHNHIEALIVNASMSLVVNDFAGYDQRGFRKSIEASAWPLVEYTRRTKKIFGTYPRYVVGQSSTGPAAFSVGYDFVAASKSVMETLCKYMSYRLYDEDIRINMLRSRSVRTESFKSTFGADFAEFAKKLAKEEHFLEPEVVADATLALCSGMLDGLRGQVITCDRGTTFFDNLMRLWEERVELGIDRA
jgi:NAD(P)-dependent dehydrogenase (short-subunit alcohol dehydrogenase family)